MAKNRIPKNVAGIRVPKALRKSKLVRGLLSSATGRDVLAKALTAGAGAAAAILVEEREEIGAATRQSTRKGARAIGIVGEAVQSAAAAAMEVVADAARAILPEPQPKGKADKPEAPARH